MLELIMPDDAALETVAGGMTTATTSTDAPTAANLLHLQNELSVLSTALHTAIVKERSHSLSGTVQKI